MASPRRIAEDGERSLIWLGDRMHPGKLPPRAVPEAVEWIEFAVSEDDAPDLDRLFTGLGFALTGRHRSKAVTRYSQGEVNLVINTEPDGLAHSQQIVHGPSVAAIGLRVGDAAAALERAEALRMAAFRQPVGPDELDIPAIRGLGGSLIYFTDATSELAGVWEVEFEPTGAQPSEDLARIDHFAQSMSPDEMLSWRLFYLSLFDFETTPQVDVIDPAGIVESIGASGPRTQPADLPERQRVGPHAQFAVSLGILRRQHRAHCLRHRRHLRRGRSDPRHRPRTPVDPGKLL